MVITYSSANDLYDYARYPASYRRAVVTPAVSHQLEFLSQYQRVTADGEQAPVIVISGDNGTGKTTLACYMCALLHAPTPAMRSAGWVSSTLRFQAVSELKEEFVEAYSDKRVTELRRKLTTPDIVILDDLGRSPPTAGFKEFLAQLLDVRADRKTVVTTNLNQELLAQIWGTEIASRLGTAGMRLEGNDNRRAK